MGFPVKWHALEVQIEIQISNRPNTILLKSFHRFSSQINATSVRQSQAKLELRLEVN